jgi:chaperonin GroEL
MPHKQILFRSAAREKILRGAAQLVDAVRVTLGPRSKSVLIEKKWGAPIVCNDGVTIAKEFGLKDPEENLGARCVSRSRNWRPWSLLSRRTWRVRRLRH